MTERFARSRDQDPHFRRVAVLIGRSTVSNSERRADLSAKMDAVMVSQMELRDAHERNQATREPQADQPEPRAGEE